MDFRSLSRPASRARANAVDGAIAPADRSTRAGGGVGRTDIVERAPQSLASLDPLFRVLYGHVRTRCDAGCGVCGGGILAFWTYFWTHYIEKPCFRKKMFFDRPRVDFWCFLKATGGFSDFFCLGNRFEH